MKATKQIDMLMNRVIQLESSLKDSRAQAPPPTDPVEEAKEPVQDYNTVNIDEFSKQRNKDSAIASDLNAPGLNRGTFGLGGIDQNENQQVELCLNGYYLDVLDDVLADDTRFQQITEENIEKMLNFVF